MYDCSRIEVNELFTAGLTNQEKGILWFFDDGELSTDWDITGIVQYNEEEQFPVFYFTQTSEKGIGNPMIFDPRMLSEGIRTEGDFTLQSVDLRRHGFGAEAGNPVLFVGDKVMYPTEEGFVAFDHRAGKVAILEPVTDVVLFLLSSYGGEQRYAYTNMLDDSSFSYDVFDDEGNYVETRIFTLVGAEE